jgi:hypothetical protein
MKPLGFSKTSAAVQNLIVCTPSPEVLLSSRVRTLFRRSAPRPDSLPRESGAAVISTFLEQTSMWFAAIESVKLAPFCVSCRKWSAQKSTPHIRALT